MLDKLMKFFNDDPVEYNEFRNNFKNDIAEGVHCALEKNNVNKLIKQYSFEDKPEAIYDYSKPAELVYRIAFVEFRNFEYSAGYDLKIISDIDKVCFDIQKYEDEFTSTFEKIKNEYEYCQVITKNNVYKDLGVDGMIIILAWNRKNEEKQND